MAAGLFPVGVAAFRQIFDGGSRRFLDDTIVLADELQDRATARIAQTGRGQFQDARVTAGAIGEPGSDVVEEDLHGLFVAEHAECAPRAAMAGLMA